MYTGSHFFSWTVDYLDVWCESSGWGAKASWTSWSVF